MGNSSVRRKGRDQEKEGQEGKKRREEKEKKM